MNSDINALKVKMNSKAVMSNADELSGLLDTLTEDLWMAYCKGKEHTDSAFADLESILRRLPNLRRHNDRSLARRAGEISLKCHVLKHNFRKHVYKDQRFEGWAHEMIPSHKGK